MKTKDFYFDLPQNLIAQVPSDKRGEDRLLVLGKKDGSIIDSNTQELASFIDEDTIIVVNNSKVRLARVYGLSDTGSNVEFLFLEENADTSWKCIVSRTKKQKLGRKYTFTSKDGKASYTATCVNVNEDSTRDILFDTVITEEFFTSCGHVPLPPYIKREDTFSDETRYQTIYSKNLGSVASPTAGLHFTKEILDEIKSKNIKVYEVTLHVGTGTFLPVRSEELEEHAMHYERYSISEEVAKAINEAKKAGKKVMAVGTTAVRCVESSTKEDGEVVAGEGKTNIFIYPGYKFKTIDTLLTNFHTPESTLLMLVSAFSTKDNILNAYRHAVENSYRFFSYGDAMLIKE